MSEIVNQKYKFPPEERLLNEEKGTAEESLH